MTWSEGIQRITGDPARRLNLANKGFVKTGYCADLVVFDPKKINAPEDYNKPEEFPIGLNYVLVNGHVVVANGEILTTAAGKLLVKNPSF